MTVPTTWITTISRQFALALLMASFLTIQASGQSNAVKIVNNNRSVSDDDHEWHGAAADARKAYPSFLERLRSPNGANGFSVKVLLRSGEKEEYIWLNPVREAAGQVRGTVNNVPSRLDQSMYGKEIEVHASDVVDWMYQVSGKTVGAYTTCASLSKTDPQLRHSYIVKYGLQCDNK